MLAGCLVLAESRRRGSPPGREHRLRGEDGARLRADSGEDAQPATRIKTTRVLRERIQGEEHANDMHDLLVIHEGRPMLEK
jgi:hypothetical protein